MRWIGQDAKLGLDRRQMIEKPVMSHLDQEVRSQDYHGFQHPLCTILPATQALARGRNSSHLP